MTSSIPPAPKQPLRHALTRWFSADPEGAVDTDTPGSTAVDWARIVPFLLMHLVCLSVIWVGYSTVAVAVAIGMYLLRIFAITAFYHRYFSHRSYKTSRAAQFLFGLLGATAAQRGPIWWSAHHRHHHAHSDGPEDVHSPSQQGFLWSHMGWFLSRKYFHPDWSKARDLLRFPELRWLDRFDILVPTLLGFAMFGFGKALELWAPELGTSGWQMLIWGFFISTIAVYHGTYTINSLAHVFGRRRYRTGDASRNNALLALLTLGEGWHNNHHFYPNSVRQGFYWWEIDITYYLLRMLAALGIIWDLKQIPAVVRDSRASRLD